MSAIHIAIVDDEPDITQLLAGYLGGHGYRVSEVHNGAALKSLMASDAADLVLLDLGLGSEDGLVLARHLREHWGCGLVIVTGRGDAVDKVVGLEIGADDYVTKPFDLRELLARIKAVLRRLAPPSPSSLPAVPPPPAPVEVLSPTSPPTAALASAALATAMSGHHLHFAGWTLDTASRRLLNARGEEVPLTGGEFELLRAFALHPGRVLSRDFLLEFTRGREAGPYERTIDVQVGRLRKKIEADAERPKIIKSVRGAGYVMSAAPSSP